MAVKQQVWLKKSFDEKNIIGHSPTIVDNRSNK